MKYPFSSYSSPLPGYGTSLVDRINVYLHIRRYLRFISERWLLLVISTVIGLAVGVWMAVTKPNLYESRSILGVPPKVQVANLSQAQIQDDAQKFTENTLQKLMSGIVINRVMAKLQEGRDNTNKLVRPVFNALPGRGNTFLLTARSTNFDYAQKFVTAWAEEFVEYKKLERAGVVSSAEASTQREILQVERNLETARDNLADFKRRYNIVDFKDAGARLRERLQRAKDERLSLETERKLYENASKEALASGALPLKDQPAGSPPRTGADADPAAWERGYDTAPQYPALILELRRMEANVADYARRLKPAHPYMVELQRTIDAKKIEIEASLRIADDLRNARVQALRIREDSLVPLIEELEQSVFESTSLENEYERLGKEELIHKDQLESLNRTLQSMGRIGTDDAAFEILERGGGENEPVSPDRPMMVGSGVLAGIVIGIAILFLLHKLDDRLESPEAIEEALEEPVLGQVPEVDREHLKEGYLMLNRMKAHTMFAESLRGVRSALLLSPEGTSKRMLAVTSAVPGDGKTTFTTNFAITLANSGNRVLLIDADLRRGNVNGYFEQPLEGGLAEVLQGNLGVREAIRDTPVKNLFFMRAGERPQNPSELLLGPATKELVMELRRDFDYVIFDCPPLTAIDDTFSIAAFLDGLFFVVRAGRTSMRFAKMGIATIRQRGAPILGLIVNGVPIDNPYYYYTTYYYSSYYHRPLSPEENMYQDNPSRQAGAPPRPTGDRPGPGNPAGPQVTTFDDPGTPPGPKNKGG